jgi:hypothetical protein
MLSARSWDVGLPPKAQLVAVITETLVLAETNGRYHAPELP